MSLIEGLNMSHIRLARISLILAAIGLNAVPAMLGVTAAHAQDKEKEKAAAEAPKDAVRPEIFKLIDPAQVKPLLDAKNFQEYQTRIDSAAAMPNLTPYESFVLNQMRVQLGQASGNNELTLKALEAMIESGRLSRKTNCASSTPSAASTTAPSRTTTRPSRGSTAMAPSRATPPSNANTSCARTS